MKPFWFEAFTAVTPTIFTTKYTRKRMILGEILISSSRKAFFTHQQTAFPASDHKTFWNDVGMTEFGKLKNGIQ